MIQQRDISDIQILPGGWDADLEIPLPGLVILGLSGVKDTGGDRPAQWDGVIKTAVK